LGPTRFRIISGQLQLRLILSGTTSHPNSGWRLGVGTGQNA